MTKIKLTYFDFNGGRGEPVRIALHAAGIPFEDIRWSFSEFAEMSSTLRFHCVPSMEFGGQQFSQSNAMSRYVGKISGLYPEDSLQALYCDEVLEALEDVTHYFVQTFGLEGDDLKEARENFREGKLRVFLQGLEECLERGGGEYFADYKLTIADLKAFITVQNFRSGNADHIPADFIDQVAPALALHQTRIEQEPAVIAYYASLED